jgi:hypothetical protein
MISSLGPGRTGHARGASPRTWLRVGPVLLPWLALLLISACSASALNHALTGAWVPLGAGSEIAQTSTVDLPPVGLVGDGDDARAVDLACVTRIAAYESEFEAVRRCSIPVSTKVP